MDNLYYILNDKGEPVTCDDVLIWGEWFETHDRTVKKTHINGVEISTVFLGLDHNFGSGAPLLYETMVFNDYDSNLIFRYATREEALHGHKVTVKKLIEESEESQQKINPE